MLRIAFFQNDVGVGGIQKSIVNLLKNIDYSRVKADLFLCENNNFFQAEFPEKLKIYNLPPVPQYYKYLPFDFALSKVDIGLSALEPYDLAIDFNSYQPACAIGAITVPAKKRVMWIHNNVRIKYHEEWKYRVLWNAFKGKFKYFDEFVPCSEALWEPFTELARVTDKPHSVIHNYIDVDDIRRKAEIPCDSFQPDTNCLNFIALGKLCHQKGYDLMLEAFAAACRYRNDLRLYILGDGPDRTKLEEQRNKLLLKDRVFFLGNQPNPYCYMQKADCFISTSRYEGQPLNIMEARVIGLPLYCSKNLEKYSSGLLGVENMEETLISAKKESKNPDDLVEYNREIIQNLELLAQNLI